MEVKEAYALGYAYGLVESKIPDYDKNGFKAGAAASRPFNFMGQLLVEAYRRGVISKELSDSLSEVLSDTGGGPEGEIEVQQPLPIQNAWQRGYKTAKSGKPYYDIAKRREDVGVSQEELAGELGVPQSSVSRWESGKVHPRPEKLAQIKQVLSTTTTGYVNRNRQTNIGRTERPGTDHMQYLYKMRCGNCGYEYHANGSDIFQKKCPRCQGGKETGVD